MKIILKITSVLIFVIFIIIALLSYGISTDKFNNKIISQVEQKVPKSKLNFKDTAVKEIAKKAISKKTGARGLRSILENLLLKTMFDLPGQNNIEEVVVDSASVKGQSQPIIVHSKNKSKTDKTTAA